MRLKNKNIANTWRKFLKPSILSKILIIAILNDDVFSLQSYTLKFQLRKQ